MTLLPIATIFGNVMSGFRYENAFVVQLRRLLEFEGGELSGRIEHVASGKTATFSSIRDLPALLQKMLSEGRFTDHVVLEERK